MNKSKHKKAFKAICVISLLQIANINFHIVKNEIKIVDVNDLRRLK